VVEEMAAEIPTVLVGRKPAMNYVAAVAMQFNAGSDKVALKARGRAISTAVTVAEIVKRMIAGVDVEKINIGTEQVGDPPRFVSSIEIILAKTE